MKRLSMAITGLTVTGIVRHSLDVRCINGITRVPSYMLAPGKEIDVIASELVTLDLVQQDNDTKEYFESGSYSVEALIKIEVRSFSVENVFNIEEKTSTPTAVVIVDLVF